MPLRLVPVLIAIVAASPLQAQVLRALTDVARADVSPGALDDAGSAVWAVTAADPQGSNPWKVPQVFRWDPVTSAATQLTFFPDGLAVSPGVPVLTPALRPPGVSVSDDGQWLAFVSRGDLAGANHDRSQELFLMRADGSVLRQLTTLSDPGAGIHQFALSGDASRAVFLSDAALLAGPAGMVQAYAVEADGTGLRRLGTATWAGAEWASISDDGERVVVCAENTLLGAPSVDDAFEVFAFDLGTGEARQLTDLEAFCRAVEISGNGTTVAFETSASGLPGSIHPSCDGGIQIATVAWSGTSLRNVSRTCGCTGSYSMGWAYGPPTMTDDGAWVAYIDEECWREVFKVRSDGTSKTPLTDVSGDYTGLDIPVVAGGGDRCAVLASNDPLFGSPNPDGGAEVATVRLDGSMAETRLSDVRGGGSGAPDVTADGTRLIFLSRSQPDGAPASSLQRLYRLDTDGSAPAAVTNYEVASPRITDDGGTVAFWSWDDPLDEGVQGAIYATGTDGTQLRRLTPEQGLGELDVAGGGAFVAYETYESPGSSIYRVNLDGSGRTLLASNGDTRSAFPRVDSAGTWVIYIGDTGWDPVIRLPADLSLPAQTLFETGSLGSWTNEGAAISADGSVVAAITVSPFGGANPEGNKEVAVWEASTGTARLLTSTTGPFESHHDLALSADGAWVYVVSEVPRFDPLGGPEIVRISVANGAVERVSGTVPCPSSGLAADLPGDVVAFVAGGGCSGGNSDGNAEIHVIDRRVAPGLAVSKASPTVVSWDVSSGPATYDVIRGDVASLVLLQGGSVDLGTVQCVENDSPDTQTRGNEDPDTPLPGQSFFYVTRGSAGRSAGPGSYGTGSAGGERTPGSGGCP